MENPTKSVGKKRALPVRGKAGRALKAGKDRRVLPRAATDSAVERLVRCRRFCEHATSAGKRYADSYEIGRNLGVAASLVRKDLSRFGRLGIRGTGYDLAYLAARLTRELGGGRKWNVALAGVGNLGSALLDYDGFRQYGFHFVAVFDTDPAKIGTKRGDVVVSHPSESRRVLRSVQADIGIITVPAAQARETADFFASAGVRAILNMAPIKLGPITNVTVSNLDLALELEKLSYDLVEVADARPQA